MCCVHARHETRRARSTGGNRILGAHTRVLIGYRISAYAKGSTKLITRAGTRRRFIASDRATPTRGDKHSETRLSRARIADNVSPAARRAGGQETDSSLVSCPVPSVPMSPRPHAAGRRKNALARDLRTRAPFPKFPVFFPAGVRITRTLRFPFVERVSLDRQKDGIVERRRLTS